MNSMNRNNPKVDTFLRKAGKWREESRKLRAILLGCGLTEEWKWRQPCYLFEGGIVVLISGFKDYCALAFFKGALLKDAKGILVKPGNHSQAMRQIRFTGVREIDRMEPILKAYIREAMAVEKAGLKVKKDTRVVIPEELRNRLDRNPALKTAFDGLTPGRQRAYAIFFSAAKQSKTRDGRIEKCIPQILQGRGLNDRPTC